MKKGIHPEYREVAFVDLSINQTFIIRSAAQTRETIEIDGVTYPMYKLDTSSASHPFYTGAQTRIVEAGRVEKFRAKFAAKQQAMNAAAEAAKGRQVILPVQARCGPSARRFQKGQSPIRRTALFICPEKTDNVRNVRNVNLGALRAQPAIHSRQNVPGSRPQAPSLEPSRASDHLRLQRFLGDRALDASRRTELRHGLRHA